MNQHSENWLYYLRRGITDLWFILSISLAVLIFVVLLGYHESDPGWSTSGVADMPVQHWLGTPGAYTADALLSLFGYAAYLLPLGLLSIGWQSARRGQIDAEMMMWKSLGLIVGVLSLAGIMSLHWPTAINSVAITTGGLAGQKMSIELLKLWPVTGVMALYTALFLIALTLLAGLNWLRLFDGIGHALLFVFAKVSDKMDGHKQRRVDAPPLADDGQGETRRHSLRRRLGADTPDKEPAAEPAVRTRREPAPEPLLQAAPPVRSEPAMSLDWSSYKGEPREEVPPPEESAPAPLAEAKTPVQKAEEAFSLGQHGMGWKREKRRDRFAGYDAFIDIDDDTVGEPTIDFGHFGVAGQTQGGQDFVDTAREPPGRSVLLADEEDDDDDDDALISTGTAPAPGNLRVKLAPLAGTGPSAAPMLRRTDSAYQLPPLSLLRPDPRESVDYTPQELEAMAVRVEQALADYRLDVRVANTEVGPVITRLEMALAPGIKVSQIANLDKDLARNLSVQSVRVVDVIPGKPYVGLEIPNRKRTTVYLRSILESPAYRNAESPLTVVLGRDIAGEPMVANLAKMPHVLVAGTTGSGKSVAINVMLASMLYKASPKELKLILVDPKMLEMSMYEDIPHLLTPVVTDMNDAENALRWAVEEMDRRYQLMSAVKVRNIAGFNAHLREARARGEHIFDPLWRAEDHIGLANQPPEIEELPYIVIVIDELADMMMVVGKRVEELIARIAQKARAAGIHLILATQRPSVDVITGLIKANVPTRIAFQVSSKIDSRTIIDQQGAEALLGMGDMLYVPPGSSAPRRVHGAFMEDHEVDALTTYLKSQGAPQYEASITAPKAAAAGSNGAGSEDLENDPLYDQAVALVIESGKASISWVQRKLGVGYNRAARMIEAMEYAGIVSSQDRGQRKVLVPRAGDEGDDDY